MRYLQFGVTIYDTARATPGFTLIVPYFCHEAYLIGMRGEVLHQWTNLPLPHGTYAYVLKNGNLLWAGRTAEGCPLQAGKGGLLREYDWDGNVLWEYRDDNQHHDYRRCKTGSTLYLGWEEMRPEAAVRVQGGQPGTEHEGVQIRQKSAGAWARSASETGVAIRARSPIRSGQEGDDVDAPSAHYN